MPSSFARFGVTKGSMKGLRAFDIQHRRRRKGTDLLHLIADVKLGWVKEQEYEVTARCKPATDLNEVVGTLHAQRIGIRRAQYH